MTKTAYHLLRVGTAITFIWIGILIFKFPEAWGGYLQSWALDLLPISLERAMLPTAVLDILIGVFLLIDVKTWVAAILASLHLLMVLTVSGITDITVRDIGLLAGSISILLCSIPPSIKNRIMFWKKQEVSSASQSYQKSY